MDGFQNEDKGLFTFYRQQADYEDHLRFQKHAHKTKETERREEKARVTHLQPNEIDNQKYSREGFRKLSHNQPITRQSAQKVQKREQIIDEIKQHPDKIIQLLEKQKHARKKKSSLKVIMKSGETIGEANSEILKAHLEELMRSERQSRSISHIQKQAKNQEITNRLCTNESKLGKAGPFDKLALLPTSFDNHHEQTTKQSSDLINPRKIIFLNNLKHKLPQKVNRLRFNGLIGENQPNKKNLPRIEMKPNNTEVMKKLEKIIDSTNKWDIKLSARWKNPVKQQDETYLKPIESERRRYKKDYSLNIECFGLIKQAQLERKSAERGQFLVFTGGQQTTQAEHRHQQQKDRLLVEIVKKLKFQ